MSLWRNSLWKICGAVILVCVAVLVVSPAINPQTLRDRLSAFIGDTTGLRVAFQGEISPRFLTGLGLTVRQVALLPPLETDGPPLATLDRLDVGVRLLPLLAGRVELGLIEVEGLDVSLVRYPDGRLNLPALRVKDVSVQGDTVLVTTPDDTVHTVAVNCQGLRLSGSRLRIDDQAARTGLTLTDVTLGTGPIGGAAPFDLKARLGYALDSPAWSGEFQVSGRATALLEALRFSLEGLSARLTLSGRDLLVGTGQAGLTGDVFLDATAGQARFQGMRLEVEAAGGALPAAGIKGSLGLDSEVDFTKGQAVARSLLLELAGLRLTGGLEARLGRNPGIVGDVSSEEFDPRALVRTLGLDLPEGLPAQALTKARLRLSLDAVPERISARGEGLLVDATTFSFSALRHFGAKPSLEVSLKADALDLDRYLPAQPAKGGAAQAKGAAAGADGPLPSFAVPVTLQAQVGRLRAAKVHASDVSVKVAGVGSKITVEPFQAVVHGGQVNGTLGIDLSRSAPAYALKVGAKAVSLEPLLAELAGKAALSGRLTASAALTAEGRTGKRLVETLNGKTSFVVTSGAILGLSLPVGTATGPGGQQSVPFEKAWGDVGFTNGVAASTNLNASAPPHKVLVHGWVNLPARTLDLAAVVNLAGRTNLPIRIGGTLDAPTYAFNTQALAKGLLEGVANAPGTVLNAPGDLGKGALDALGGMLGIPKK